MTDASGGRGPGGLSGAGGSIASEALQLSLTGDIDGALALLRAARENAPLDQSALSLMFKLLQDRGPGDEVFDICAAGIELAEQSAASSSLSSSPSLSSSSGRNKPITRSTWHLRRGLLHVEGRNREDAVRDLLLVLKLKASDDHTAQAQKALLAAAQLPARSPKR